MTSGSLSRARGSSPGPPGLRSAGGAQAAPPPSRLGSGAGRGLASFVRRGRQRPRRAPFSHEAGRAAAVPLRRFWRSRVARARPPPAVGAGPRAAVVGAPPALSLRAWPWGAARRAACLVGTLWGAALVWSGPRFWRGNGFPPCGGAVLGGGPCRGPALPACHSRRGGPCPLFRRSGRGAGGICFVGIIPAVGAGCHRVRGGIEPPCPRRAEEKCNVFPCLSHRWGGAHVARAALPCCGSLACRGYVCSPPLPPAPLPLWGRGWRSCAQGLGVQWP